MTIRFESGVRFAGDAREVNVDIEKSIECVLAAAVRAFCSGTRSMRVHGDAVKAFRRRFARRVQAGVVGFRLDG
jgi:hypothetical protein